MKTYAKRGEKNRNKKTKQSILCANGVKYGEVVSNVLVQRRMGDKITFIEFVSYTCKFIYVLLALINELN